MKKAVLFLLFSWTVLLTYGQTICQQGVTYRYNGKNPHTPIGKVYIKSITSPNAVLSDSVSGAFTLQLPNLKMDSRIGSVRVTKKGMMIFNQQTEPYRHRETRSRKAIQPKSG